MKPESAPIPTDLRESALQTIRDAKFPMVATIDGDQPRVPPVSPLRVDGFTVYFPSLRSSHQGWSHGGCGSCASGPSIITRCR